MAIRTVLALAALIWLPASAVAATTPIAVDARADWLHQESKVGFPARIDDFTRTEVRDSTSNQSDITLLYRDAESQTLTSIFLFRAGIVDVALWQDRILRQIAGLAHIYGTADTGRQLNSTFTPGSGGSDSASRIVFPLSGKDSSATGSAVLASDKWLIAVRMTSRRLPADVLDARLASLVSKIMLPKAQNPSPRFRAIDDCADRTLPTKNAKRAAADMTQGLIMGVMAMPVDDEEKDKSEKSVESGGEFCRVTSDIPQGVYRRTNEQIGYYVAFGDAGIVAHVSPSIMAELQDKDEKVSLTLITTETNMFYRGFKSTPTVDQIVTVINTEQPTAQVGRTLETSRTISVTPSGK